MKKKETNHVLCTLFDSNYLDKGLVLYKSLEKHASNFTLYVLAMNDKCYEILSDLHYEHLIPIRLEDFENEDLLRVKPERGVGEYCWTCSSSLIKYVLDTYKPDYCSYIDADMAFYADPFVLIEEMELRNASVSIVGHRFNFYNRDLADRVGTYCVECNTFKNDEKARKLLNIWISQCLEHCSIDGDGIYWADQKYMDNWVSDYKFVIETQHLGAGVAPWNIAQYRLLDDTDFHITLKCKGKKCNLLFYHFENLKYLSVKEVNICVYNSWGISDTLVKYLYQPYLKAIDDTKTFLREKYGLNILIKSHPGVNIESNKQRDYHISFKRLRNILFSSIPTRLYRNKNIFRIS